MGIDASSDEGTEEPEFRSKIAAWEGLSQSQRESIAENLLEANRIEVERFMQDLKVTVTRQVASVRIMSVHGLLVERITIEEAITCIQEYSEEPSEQPFARYAVEVLYNGNKIDGHFLDKASAVQFLRDYAPPTPTAAP